jgi:hypothetical protein
LKQIYVTHPFHPLYGQEFEFVTHNKSWGEDRVFYYNSAGKLLSMPACWTSAVTDSFVQQSAGRAVLRFEDLSSLAMLLRELKEQ